MRVGLGLLLVAFAVLGLVGLSGWLVGYGAIGLTAYQVLFFALPVLLVAAREGGMGTIGLRWPRGRIRDIAGGALIGAAAWAVLATLILPVQERFYPTPPEAEQAIRDLVVPSLAGFLAVTLVPALCEELLFRGALGFALDRRFGRKVAVLGAALAFAAVHGSTHRFLPTFLLGLSFGVIALHSGSVVPSMVAHAINNAAIWLLTTVPALAEPLESHGIVVGAVATATLLLGHILVFLRFPRTR